MALEGVNGMAVAATAGGALLLWSGIKGAKPSAAFQALISGKQPAGQDPSMALQGTGTITDASPGAASGGSTAAAGGSSGNKTVPAVSGGSNQAVLRQVAASFGWTGQQWTCLYNVEMAEAGFNLTAKNPSSGAYGMAQFINGPSEYAQYGGNATTAFGQSVGMCNYIKQRYGTPCAAWAHEQSMHWY